MTDRGQQSGPAFVRDLFAISATFATCLVVDRQITSFVLSAIIQKGNKVMPKCCVLSIVGLLLLCGCSGPEGPEMVDISGKVTYQGEPIKEGAIKFVPKNAADARVTPVEIVNGAYSATGDRGLAVGSYTVQFSSTEDDLAGSADPAQEGGDIDPSMVRKKELLPEEHTTNSAEELTVEPGTGSITKDFALE